MLADHTTDAQLAGTLLTCQVPGKTRTPDKRVSRPLRSRRL